MEQIREAAAYLRGRVHGEMPSVLVVLGSGSGDFVELLEDPQFVPYRDVPHMPYSTVAGHAGQFAFGTMDGKPVVLMCGRVHVYEGYSARQVVFPIRVLHELGAKIAILTNAAGAINRDYRPGDFMMISDHINIFGENPLTGDNMDELGPRFPDLSDAYDRQLRRIAWQVANEADIPMHEGMYIYMPGPSFETPAEIRMCQMLGADAVGMSTVHEVIAARHMDMRVFAMSTLTNMAAGLAGQKLSHEEVLTVGASAQERYGLFIRKMIQRV